MKWATPLVLASLLAVALGAAVKNTTENGVLPHVLGGEEVKLLDRPYAVRLRLNKDGKFVRYCAATRLDRYSFLTAAECLDKEKYDRVQLLFPADIPGRYWDTKEFDFWTLRYSIHPEYNNVTKANNIAVLSCFFCSALQDTGLLPELPKRSEKSDSFSNAKAVVSGWTIVNASAEVQPDYTISSYNTTMVSPFLCKLAYFFRSVGSDNICASSWGGKRITEGHVGAPLIAAASEPSSRSKLIGIAASIQPWTTKLPVPTVFTKVGPYVEWISQETGIAIEE